MKNDLAARALAIRRAATMMGGLAEYSSMALGFQYLVLVAMIFYALSAIGLIRADDTAFDHEPAEAVAAEV